MDGKEEAVSARSTRQANNVRRIQELNEAFFAKTKDYLQSELELTLDDYLLLEKMNLRTAEVGISCVFFSFHFGSHPSSWSKFRCQCCALRSPFEILLDRLRTANLLDRS